MEDKAFVYLETLHLSYMLFCSLRILDNTRKEDFQYLETLMLSCYVVCSDFSMRCLFDGEGCFFSFSFFFKSVCLLILVSVPTITYKPLKGFSCVIILSEVIITEA
jgi:hypothetical protein